MAKKVKRGPGHRYTATQKQHILETAEKEGLTGDQVRKRFGVSTLTFYRWRGPVRGRRRPQAPPAARVAVHDGTLREQLRAGIRKALPRLIQDEVAAALEELLGKR